MSMRVVIDNGPGPRRGVRTGRGLKAATAAIALRWANSADAPALHALIAAHLEEGRLLPRTLDELDRLAPHIREMGALFEQKLNALQKQHKVITGVKGAGLMQGLHLSVDAQPVIEASLKAGLLVNRTAERVVRMLPPLTVTAAEIEEASRILDGALRSVSVEEVKA